MVALNRDAAGEALAAGVHAMTDVTGFGLLGHLHNLCRESGLAAEVIAADIPLLPGTEQLLAHGDGVSGGARRNAAWAERFVSFDEHLPEPRRLALADPTTSGGLLAALPPAAAGGVRGAVIGHLLDGPPGTIRVR
jgi:selenide,water dikinase